MTLEFGSGLVSGPDPKAKTGAASLSTWWPRILSEVHGSADIDGRSLIILASNDYLGLGADPAVVRAAQAALEAYGAGTGMNPILGVTRVHHELMDGMREFTGCEDVLLFSSCTAANCALIGTLIGTNDIAFSDELNHASIIDGCRLGRGRTVVYRHCDMRDLEALVGNASGSNLRLIVTDGVFSMEGDVAPLPELKRLSRDHRAAVVIDESHAAGVIGPSGRGTPEHFGFEGSPPVQTGTFSKAFGAGTGGYVAGPTGLIQELRARARFFIFTSGMPASAAGAAVAALNVIRTEPERLARLRYNVRRLRGGLEGLHLQLLPTEGPIIPIMVGASDEARRLSATLLNLGVYVPAMTYPIVPEGSARLRAQVSSAHSDEAITTVLVAFERALERVRSPEAES